MKLEFDELKAHVMTATLDKHPHRLETLVQESFQKHCSDHAAQGATVAQLKEMVDGLVCRNANLCDNLATDIAMLGKRLTKRMDDVL